MWEVSNMEYCPECEMTFWVCKFITTFCIAKSQFKEFKDEAWYEISVDYNLFKTYEDLYYDALYWLYYKYVAE